MVRSTNDLGEIDVAIRPHDQIERSERKKCRRWTQRSKRIDIAGRFKDRSEWDIAGRLKDRSELDIAGRLKDRSELDIAEVLKDRSEINRA